MNKIIKVAGVWVAAEVLFALGKGHMLSCVRRFDPEVGDEIRNVIEVGSHAENCSILRRASGAVICSMDDFMTWLYANRCEHKERG